MELEPIIGLEIHIQLKTRSKMFCPCDNNGEDKPINTCICEICMAHPGTLPVPNKTAVEWAVKVARALHCTVPHISKFDRKHYFYPDLPKGYQISQYDKPIGKNGYLEIGDRKIRINRLHLEEDAAKLLHASNKTFTVVDYNRAGTPLVEIVTEPDIPDTKTAGLFLRELRSIIRALEISDADMEKGHLRCDANVSLKEKKSSSLNPKTEIKNLNSFKAIEHALSYEIKRQTLLWDKNTPPHYQSTRGWDDNKGMTTELRTKEHAHDYRYFPEPDIPPIVFKTSSTDALGKHAKIKKNQDAIDVNAIAAALPELPQQKRVRFVEQYGFSEADATVLTRDYSLADFSEHVMSELSEWVTSAVNTKDIAHVRLTKLAANWLINNLTPAVNHNWDANLITAENFAEFILLIAQGKISSRAAQNVLTEMISTNKDPSDIIEEQNLTQVDDSSALLPLITRILNENPHVVQDYKSGKINALKFLMGAVMKETHGTAHPSVVESLLKKELSS